MKRTHRCPKCSSQRIVLLPHVLDAADWSGAGNACDPAQREAQNPVRRQLAVVARRGSHWFQSTVVEHTADTEAYVCTECGYFEEYVKNPQAIPWGEVEGATWLAPC